MEQFHVHACLLFVCVLGTSLIGVRAQPCDRSIPVEEETESSASVGSGLCTWTFTTYNATFNDPIAARLGEMRFKVLLEFTVVNLTQHDICDTTNSIVIYDGDDTSGTILGLVCGNLTSTFESTGNHLTLTYPASEITSPAAFTVKYTQTYPIWCSATTVHAVSETDYSLLSPMYPTGARNVSYECDITLLPRTDKDRIRVSWETTGTTCDDVSVKVYLPSQQTADTLCPGDTRVIQSSGFSVILTVKIAKGFSTRIKYRMVKGSDCGGDLNATAVEQLLTTPGYPSPYEAFTECVWVVKKLEWTRNTTAIRIDIVESDMDETENCTTDSLTLLNGGDLYDDVMYTYCGGTPKSYFVYDFKVMIKFTSTKPANTRRGIKIKYYTSPAEPCGGNVTARAASQTLQSPGFPIAYPDYARCVWSITPESPDKFVEVEVLVNDIFQAFDSCYFGDKVDVYDGRNTDADFRLGRVCGRSGRPSYQGYEDTLTVVFFTDSTASNGGFKMSYKETEGPVLFNRRIESELRDAETISSTRYPDGKISNVNSSWTITPRLSGQVMLTFTDVDLGDPAQCSTNYIRVVSEAADSGPSQVSTLCGKEQGVYLSRNSALSITMVTDNALAKRGFVAQHVVLYNDETDGCRGSPAVMDFYSSELKTINYPNPYPNFADCSYQLTAFGDHYFLQITIADIDLVNPGDCNDDFMEFYDGNSTDSPLLARVCTGDIRTINTTGHRVFIKFVSDSKLSGRGVKLSINTEWKETAHDERSYVWVIILVAVLGGVVIVGVVIYRVVKKHRRGGSAAI